MEKQTILDKLGQFNDQLNLTHYWIILLKYKRIGISQCPANRPLYLSTRLLPLDMRLEFSQKLDPFKNEEQLVKYNTVKVDEMININHLYCLVVVRLTIYFFYEVDR